MDEIYFTHIFNGKIENFCGSSVSTAKKSYLDKPYTDRRTKHRGIQQNKEIQLISMNF